MKRAVKRRRTQGRRRGGVLRSVTLRGVDAEASQVRFDAEGPVLNGSPALSVVEDSNPPDKHMTEPIEAVSQPDPEAGAACFVEPDADPLDQTGKPPSFLDG